MLPEEVVEADIIAASQKHPDECMNRKGIEGFGSRFCTGLIGTAVGASAVGFGYGSSRRLEAFGGSRQVCPPGVRGWQRQQGSSSDRGRRSWPTFQAGGASGTAGVGLSARQRRWRGLAAEPGTPGVGEPAAAAAAL
eukprot:g46180.t1